MYYIGLPIKVVGTQPNVFLNTNNEWPWSWQSADEAEEIQDKIQALVSAQSSASQRKQVGRHYYWDSSTSCSDAAASAVACR